MAKGWIRAYNDEFNTFKGKKSTGKDYALFRKSFTTALFEAEDENAAVLVELKWDDQLELPEGIGADSWTKVIFEGQEGFVRRWHVVEIGYLAKDEDDRDTPYTTRLELSSNAYKKDLLWGDLIQIRKRENGVCSVRARGWFGKLPSALITQTALLDISFIDVGQGDGVLVRYPEGDHLLIDGGLSRRNQMTGKNAADFIDWKFFADYGNYAINLNGIMASHCDADHYGGLWDLIKKDTETDAELDCVELNVADFFHAGLSNWKKKDDTHKDELGPTDHGWFIRLLNDRVDAEQCLDQNNADTLSGNWKKFIKDIIELDNGTNFHRLGVREEDLKNGHDLPEIWEGHSICSTKVLAPVTKNKNGNPALKDLGDTGINKNGHSICLRVDIGKARILLTGDLNSASMDWLAEAYGDDRIDNFNCDVAKACHHGSHDISFKFLKHINAGATVISSGDAEGYAHPRPEVVAASAVTGHVEVDEEKDVLVTPLIYMTEIERSVSLGKVTHIRMNNYPVGGGNTKDKALLAMDRKDISDSALFSYHERKAYKDIDDDDEKKVFKDTVYDREKALLKSTEEDYEEFDIDANYHYRSVHKLFTIQYGNQRVKGTRILTKNHYGLVNIRTDGETIMCATMKESGGGWTIHTFDARFT